jgi:hypothetical protein
MGEHELNRRKILSGIAAVGGTGAIVGSGVGAFYSDEATFGNDTLEPSASIAGTVDLELQVESFEYPTKVEYTVDLSADGDNNPAYVWLRTKRCPSSLELAEALTVELSINCDGRDETIDRGTLIDVLTRQDRRNGRLLCEDSPCLQPGDDLTLILEVTGITDEYDGDPQLEFEFEFYGRQCRYTEATENPFDPGETIEECRSTSGDETISFIAFCSRSGATLDPTIQEVLATDDDGDPTSVQWSTDADVDYVVVKGGQYFTIYDYSDHSYQGGIATTGGDSSADFYGTAGNHYSSQPSELADWKLDVSEFPNDGTSVKLEYDEESGFGGEDE